MSEKLKFVGIDLAGSEKRETGFCVMDERVFVNTKILFKDSEILEEVRKARPKVIAIDAPLALPKGRLGLEKKYAKFGHLRECDKQLLKMGIKFFPITLGPMRKLTLRGMNLKKMLEKDGFKVIETYPGGAQDILKIPRKRNLKKLRKGLERMGIKGFKRELNEHELDAITCALVGKMYIEGKYMALGDEKEALLILPKDG